MDKEKQNMEVNGEQPEEQDVAVKDRKSVV